MYDAVALDLDGCTLLDDHTISQTTVEKIRELSNLKIQIMICTGRSLPGVYKYVQQLALDKPLPCVLYNGAVGVEFARGGVDPASTTNQSSIFKAKVPANTTKAILSACKASGHLCQYYVGDKIFVHACSDSHTSLVERYASLTGAKHFHVDENYSEAIAESPEPEKTLIMAEEDDVDNVYANMLALNLPEGTNVIKGGFFVEVLATSKGSGCACLVSHLGLDRKNLIAFGDGYNDLEFIRDAGYGVAMLNGREVIKQVAKRITQNINNEEGVLKEFIMLQAEGLLPIRR
ncbi:hypothetical protein ScalyP_jg11403 [Parmales sp. scaly parma]|nr:hypothetical protein ScalyP_jg11403 [Parmales sp. scaly parma]